MSVFVIGSTSGLGSAIATSFAKRGHSVHLVARDLDALRRQQELFGANGLVGQSLQLDLLDEANVNLVGQAIANQIEKLDDQDPAYVVVSTGSMLDIEDSAVNSKVAANLIDINFRNVVCLLTPIAEAMRKKGDGSLILIGSVAGDRGRQSNYIYGAAKAGLHAYAQGLRNRLFASGVHVLTVKPGFLNTKMYRDANPDGSNRFLVGQPESAAETIYRATVKRKNVIYVNSIWRWIMFIIRSLPESIFKRTDL